MSLAALLVTLAATATPSYAHFKTLFEKLEEPAVTVTNAGEFIFLGEGEKKLGAFKCPTGEIKVHALFGKILHLTLPIHWSELEPGKGLSNDFSITVLKWGAGCLAEISGQKVKLNISENCLLDILQGPHEQSNLMAALRTPCNIEAKVLGCKIEIPGASVETGETNGHLEGLNISEPSFEHVKIESNIKGIVAKGGGLCPKSEKADLLGFEVELAGAQID